MTSYEKLCDFGHYLQTARRTKAKSLEEVAAHTKIPVYRLRQLENEELADLPAPVFVKGFIRAYAAVVGADVEDALQRFDACCALHLPAHSPAPQETQAVSHFWTHLLLALLLMAGIIAGTLLVSNWKNNLPPAAHQPPMVADPVQEPVVDMLPQTEKPALEPPSGPAVAPSATIDLDETTVLLEPSEPQGDAMTDGPVPIADPQIASEQARRQILSEDPEDPPPDHTLQIEAFEPTWLKISSDEKTPVELSLQPDSRMSFSALDHFSLHIGNAGGITLTLNGRPLGVPGKRGQVIFLRLP